MEPKELLYSEEDSWKSRPYHYDLYASSELPNVSPITQVQAVCFLDSDHIVLYKHKGGWLGLPGGHLNEGEDLEGALKRELMEEAGLKLEKYKIIGYEKVWWLDKPLEISYFLRFVTKVSLYDFESNDPDDKSAGREIFTFEEALKKLGYGKKGEFLLGLARKSFKDL